LYFIYDGFKGVLGRVGFKLRRLNQNLLFAR